MSTSQQVDPLIGRLVDGRYRVRARIARGGMATVYVATDLRLERRVALKVMHGHLSDDSVFQSRFIQEARSAARLSDPHVVNVFDQGQDGELAYLVMEYLPGITLRELLKEQRRLTVAQTITIMDAVLAGLAAAHRAGLIHRDVKPENVLLAEDGRIKIGDFGLARASSANTATGQQLLGTIAYLAPELVTRGTADARSDIYALGILLYEMLAGEQPYKGEQPMQIAFQHATDSVPRPSVKNPGVPEQLDELVLWATEKNPDERPADAQEMLDRLREIERQLGVSPLPARSSPAFETRVLPPDGGAAGATKVLPGVLPQTGDVTAAMHDTGPAAEPDNASRLRRHAGRRRRRGGLLLALVLVLAAVAAGAGWWFGSGPGSQVAVPQLAGLTFEEAQQRLAQQELEAVEAHEPSLDVPVGETLHTEPAAGVPVDRGTEVTVVTSSGPAEVELGSFEGMSLDEAHRILDEHNIAYDDAENLLLYTDAPADQVVGLEILPAGSDERIDCFAGCAADQGVHQGDTADLIVSLGPLADVTGRQTADARQILEDAELTVTVREEYSNDVPADTIIRVEPRAERGHWRPGDEITIVRSLGQQLFPIPDVVGMHRDEALSTLRDAGFAVEYDSGYDDVRNDCVTAKSTSPDANQSRPAGASVSVTFGVPFFDIGCLVG